MRFLHCALVAACFFPQLCAGDSLNTLGQLSFDTVSKYFPDLMSDGGLEGLFGLQLGPQMDRSLLHNDTKEEQLSDQDDYDPVRDFSLQFDSFTVFTFFCIALSLIVASASGIGGGGILVPIYILMLGAPGKVAIPLSNATILGGGIGNNLFTFRKRHQLRDSPMIDYDTVLMLEPLTIFGAVIGSFLNKVLPEFILILLLSTSLALTAVRTMRKGLAAWAKETEQMEATGGDSSYEMVRVDEADAEDDDDDEEQPDDGDGQDDSFVFHDLPPSDESKGDFQKVSSGDDKNWSVDKNMRKAALARIQDEEKHHPLWKIGFLCFCFVGVMLLDFMKDSRPCGSPTFWFTTTATIPWVFAFTFIYRSWLLKRTALKKSCGYKFVQGDVDWNDRTTILYPVLCTAAGFLAGMFGVGGGMIKGPLVLEMGLTPLQAHATGMFMILFTSGSACVAFLLFGQLNLVAGALLFVMGLVCTAIGQYSFDVIFKRNKRQSIIVLAMGSVISLSAVLLTVRSVLDAMSREDKHSLVSFGTLCAAGQD